MSALRRVRRRFLFSAAVSGLALQMAVAQTAPKVTFEEADGYSRLEFGLGEPSDYTADIQNNVLILGFDRSVPLDLESLSQMTSEHVVMIRQDADGRTLRMALKGETRLHSSAVDDRVAIDFVDLARTEDPADIVHILTPEEIAAIEEAKRLEEEAARLAALGEEEVANQGLDDPNLPVLPVQLSKNPNSSRITFEWPEMVGYDVIDQGDKAIITFNQLARPKLARLRVDPPPHIRSVGAAGKNGGLEVTFDLAPDTQISHFRDDANVVLTLRKIEGRPADHDEGSKSPAVAAADVSQGDAAIDHGNEAAMHQSNQEEKPVAREPDHKDHVASHEPERSVTESSHVGSPKEALENGSSDHYVKVNDPGKVLHVKASNLPRGVELKFPWGKQVPATVFSRGDYLWIVYDAVASLDFANVGTREYPNIKSIEHSIYDEATIIRMALRPGTLVTAVPEADGWSVQLGDQISESAKPLQFTGPVNEDRGSVVTVELPSVSRSIRLKDPEVGDELFVVPAFGPSAGVISPRTFVSFVALASAHGLVVTSRVDRLKVQRDHGIIEIIDPQGNPYARAPKGEAVAVLSSLPEPASPGFMDFSEWGTSSHEAYFRELSELRRELAIAKGDAINDVRMKLARFYLAHGLAAESIGYLELIRRRNEEYAQRPSFLALEGVSQLLMGRPKKAAVVLKHPSLRNDPSSALWLAMANEQKGDHPTAREGYRLGQSMVSYYPSEWQARFMISAARTALAVNDLAGAEQAISRIPVQGVKSELLLERRFLQGEAAEKLGETVTALDAYRAVEAAVDGKLAAEAAYKRILLQVKLGEITTNDAIEQLDILRYRWRGDDLELQVMKSLGELHISLKQYRQGMSVMRGALAHYPKHPVTREISNLQYDTFEDLFLGGKADEISPVAALGLYYDFKELTPIGVKGDQMIRLLSDRLVKVDLLDKASELLEHQIKHRLRGAARSQVATKLAYIHLLNQKPAEALRVMRETMQTRLPEELSRRRHLIEARALAELGRYSHAVEILEEDGTEEARRLQADIYWDSDDLRRSAVILEEMLDKDLGTGNKANANQRRDILRVAVAYALDGDKTAVDRIRQKYNAQIEHTQDAQAFEIITGGDDVQDVEFRDLVSRIANVDTLKAFMESYKDEIGEGT